MPSSLSKITGAALADFWKTNIQKCTSSVVFLNHFLDPKIATTLCAKRVAADCHLFFSQVGTYTYTYSHLFRQLLVWSMDPGTFGKKGFMGSHVTIGMRGTQWDVHETVYTSFQNPNGYTLISPSKTVVRFRIGTGGQLTRVGKGRLSNLSIAVPIWDTVRNDAIQSGRFSGGGGKKRTYAMMRRSRSPSQEESQVAHEPEFAEPDADTWDIFVKQVGDGAGALRLAYVPPERLDDVADAWLSVIGDTQGVQMWSDVAGRASYLFYQSI